MLRWFGLFGALYGAGLCPGAQPFDIQITGLASAWFPGGATIQIPAETCAEIQVKLKKPESGEARIDEVELKVDGVYPKFRRLTGQDVYFFPITSREPLGLFTKPSHVIDAALGGRKPIATQWIVKIWERPYIEASAVGQGGIPVGVTLEVPSGGLILRGGQEMVRFKGRVTGGMDPALTIQGRKVNRIASRAGFEFDQEIALEADAREVFIQAEDSRGDARLLVLRVR